MTQQPHQTPAFAHAAEFTIVLTFVVAGGKRPRTAHRRGDRVLEQIADYTEVVVLDGDPAALQLLPDLMASR